MRKYIHWFGKRNKNLFNQTTPISSQVNRKRESVDPLNIKENVQPASSLYPPPRMFSSRSTSHLNKCNKGITKKLKTDIAIFQGEVKCFFLNFYLTLCFTLRSMSKSSGVISLFIIKSLP